MQRAPARTSEGWSTDAMFPAVRLTACFPELHGFVLLDPARLDDALSEHAEGRDLRLGL